MIKIVVAKAHEAQLNIPENKREVESVSSVINKANLQYKENAINFISIEGRYKHIERKMITICLFVNKTPETICELHGDICLSFKELDAEIAKMTIDFDEQFMGEVKPNEGLLVHLGIPVRGLNKDTDFSNLDFDGVFENVRVTYVEKQSAMKVINNIKGGVII